MHRGTAFVCARRRLYNTEFLLAICYYYDLCSLLFCSQGDDAVPYGGFVA